MSLSGIFLVAIVALIVLGPRELPKAMQRLGFMLRRAQQWWRVVGDLSDKK